jgi:hypothetical protein
MAGPDQTTHETEGPSGAVTADLLARPWILSQRRLLTERQLADEFKRRGLFVSDNGLEALHQHGVLVPWLRVDRDLVEIRREFRRRQPSPWHWELLAGSPSTQAPGLLEEWSAGRVRDGLREPFEPWRRRVRRHGDVRYHAWDYLYSPYQLLLLPECQEVIAFLARRRRPPWADAFLAARKRAALQQRIVIPLLSELELVYYASVRRRYTVSHEYGSEEDYLSARHAFDPPAVLAASGWDPAALLKVAENWLFTARMRDPLRNWTALVGLIDPRKWERLEGEALLAMDYRIAAEMVLRFLEDLAEIGAAAPMPDYSKTRSYHPLDDRIGRRRARLDRTLTDFGISPHPAVVLVLEGPSEMFVMKELMDYFRVPRLDSFIRLQLLGGVDKQTELLARYLAPALGETEAHLAEMDRPPTRLMIVVDQEGAYSTAARRSSAKEQLVKHLYNALEPEHQTPAALKELEHLVEIETWGESPKNLEFAHVTDRALARAIIATGRAPATVSFASVEARLARLRAGGGNIKRVWSSWPDPKPDKVQVWRRLWPVLHARIQRARARGTEERIPLVRVLFQAYRLAGGPRSNTVFRVGP